MKGVQILTDKNHEKVCFEVFPAEQVARAQTLVLQNEQTVEGFYGFGVAITPASCYLLAQMEQAERTALLKHIYGKEGLGLSVGRLCIGSSDYSAEVYSYDDVPFDTALMHFSVERDEKYVIPMIREILAINPDLYLFASPWSPPGWMKTGGELCGGYMRAEFVDCYADYIIKFVQAYAAHGIRVAGITPQNEPNTQQKGLMPACIWHPEIEAAFVQKLREKSTRLGLNLKIWLFDHNFADAGRVLWSLENCKGLCDAIDGVAFHYYEGSIEETRPVRAAYPDLELHFTEGGPRLYDNYATDWCKWGMMIIKALSHGYKSFTGWNLMLNEMGGPNVGPFFCGGLVTRDSVSGIISYSGQYKAFSHIAPYLTPKSRITPVTVDETFGEDMFAYPRQKRVSLGVAVDNGDGKTVLLLCNPEPEKKRQVQFSVQGTRFYAELPADSISTLILE